MSICEHNMKCSGFGWAHDTQVTSEQAEELGLPTHGEVSFKKAKRAMRAHRRTIRLEAEVLMRETVNAQLRVHAGTGSPDSEPGNESAE